MLNYNEYQEFQNIVKLIPMLNSKGIDVTVTFASKANITVVTVDNEPFAWDDNIVSQETKDNFYRKVEELLENE